MARRAVFAVLVLAASLPALAQQPVYPSYPPPPQASGDNAPHPQAPDQTDGQPDQNYPDQNYPNQSYPDQTSGNAAPQQQTPQKPSPYPQANQPQPPADSQYGQPAPPMPADSLSWVPQGMEALGRTAAFHTNFTFDRSMLQLASGLWEGSGDPGFNAAVARLNGISVHSYHYAAPGMYDPRLLDAVRRQYSMLGWQHLVTAHSGANGGATDLWISFHHMQATGAVVIFESPTNLNLIAFSGNLSPLDLLHLRGHFGIPRFSGDRFVPAPGPAAQAASPARY